MSTPDSLQDDYKEQTEYESPTEARAKRNELEQRVYSLQRELAHLRDIISRMTGQPPREMDYYAGTATTAMNAQSPSYLQKTRNIQPGSIKPGSIKKYGPL